VGEAVLGKVTSSLGVLGTSPAGSVEIREPDSAEVSSVVPVILSSLLVVMVEGSGDSSDAC